MLVNAASLISRLTPNKELRYRQSKRNHQMELLFPPKVSGLSKLSLRICVKILEIGLLKLRSSKSSVQLAAANHVGAAVLVHVALSGRLDAAHR